MPPADHGDLAQHRMDDLRVQRAESVVWTEMPGDALRVECFGCGREIGPFKAYWLGVRPGARTRACTDCHAKAENRA